MRASFEIDRTLAGSAAGLVEAEAGGRPHAAVGHALGPGRRSVVRHPSRVDPDDSGDQHGDVENADDPLDGNE
jgi:hypothetical protein